VHHAADLPCSLLGEKSQGVFVGVAAVDDQWLAYGAGDGDLSTKDLALRLRRREVAEEVEPHLAEAHHLRLLAGEPLHLREVRLRRLFGVVRMDAHRRPHVGESAGHRHHRPVRLPIRTDGDHAANARRVRPIEHGLEIIAVVRKMQVGVRVEEAHQRLMIAQGTTSKRRRPMSWPEAVITSTR